MQLQVMPNATCEICLEHAFGPQFFLDMTSNVNTP